MSKILLFVIANIMWLCQFAVWLFDEMLCWWFTRDGGADIRIMLRCQKEIVIYWNDGVLKYFVEFSYFGIWYISNSHKGIRDYNIVGIVVW